MDDRKPRKDADKAASRAANALEIACVNNLQAEKPGCAYTFTRTFTHADWVDFESLVQAGKTPEESGINERFHRIEADLDALGDNVRRAFACLEELRAQLRVCLNEIVTALNAKPTPNKDKEAAKDTKDNKDNAEAKSSKDNKDQKDTKDNQEAKRQKDTKDNKEGKEDKDASEKERKENTKDALGAIDKKDADRVGIGPFGDEFHLGSPLRGPLPIVGPAGTDLRVFIGPDERPVLGERSLNEPRTE